jgi:RimJ/RimL family protein N-acetyltransferase
VSRGYQTAINKNRVPKLVDGSVGRRYNHDMLRGEKVGLRARHEDDKPVLHAELYDDIANHTRSSDNPWLPIAPGSSASPFTLSDSTDTTARFSVVRLADNVLAGAASLWGINFHHRTAHIGLSLRPDFRNSGLGTDTVRVLCHYGFTIRGLQRIQIDTLADNTAMIKVAGRVGFIHEGTLRHAAWVNGSFVDEVVLGLLASDHVPQLPARLPTVQRHGRSPA